MNIQVGHFLMSYNYIFGIAILFWFQTVVLGVLIHLVYFVIVYIVSRAILVYL